MSGERARDAMVAAPTTHDVSESAQTAGEALARPEVRAVLVCDGPRLVGVITRKTLVRRVVAEGRDPRGTTLGEIAEPPYVAVDADQPLEDAMRLLEERDLERAPVVDAAGDLLGVLSRSVVQRRLAEDEPLPDEPDELVSV